ncbi:MAG: NAD(P)/FAD-dependent oxidoreductase [Terriglobales bacterium]
MESPNSKSIGRGCVVGAGPNGLAAAITLAQAGVKMDVFEAEEQPGGAARTLELTLPGFLHDFGSAVYPMAAGSPFFSSLSLEKHGLEWIHSPAALAHPFDDGTAVMLERDLGNAEAELGKDGKAWQRLMRPFAEHWMELADGVLRPILSPSLPRHPWLLARFGLKALPSAQKVARSMFRGERARAVFGGIAAHSVLSLDAPSSAAAGVLLGAALHAVGWPIPRGGAQSITQALCNYLADFGTAVTTSTRVENLATLSNSSPNYGVTLCDVTPRQLVRLAGDRLSPGYRNQLARYRYGPGVFKVDYALRQPIPWKAKECWRAATVHLGGSFEEIAVSEAAMANGRHADRPFVLLAQPSLFDPTRAPEGRHTAWAYCHVPNGSTFDMLSRLEGQIERFAPGFGDCILARRVFSPAALEEMDANLVGGDVIGGAMDLRQLLFRPTWRQYATSAPDIYLCSASTPPGGGVHGMCGHHAARLAVSRLEKHW